MFLSKFLTRLTNALGIKWQLVLVELIIVFVGVYLAFFLNSLQEEKYIQQESDKIWSSLKIELEGIRLSFPVWADNQTEQNVEWDSLFAIEEIGNFYTWRYIQPQYDFTTIQYAIDSREGNIVDFDMYKRLTDFYQNVQQLEHSENLMTELGLRYRNIPRGIDKSKEEYWILFGENKFLFYKFLDFSKMRAGILRRIAKLSEDILDIINQKLGEERQQILEREFIHQQIVLIGDDAPKAFLQARIKENFPNISDSDIEEIYLLAKEEFEHPPN
ncbi:MAG: hypothetical protein KTR30_11605 [Saprospiraceae bacterium]|nr:hypothetical protein [Saprospiraceae bacterium]